MPEAPPGSDRAAEALSARAAGQSLTLYFTPGGGFEAGPDGFVRDRYGRLHGHAEVAAGGIWLQERLIREGVAVVDGAGGLGGACLSRLLDAEALAREARAGLWGGTARVPFRILRPEETWDHAGAFIIAEGVIDSAALVRGRLFVNFGADWREDFTATAARAEARDLTERHGPPEGWAGRRVRVRGWAGLRNGPQVILTYPQQLLFLPAAREP